MTKPDPGSADDAIDLLVAMLSSTDRFERSEAARRLCNLGWEGLQSLPRLLALSRDPCYLVRVQVPRALMRMDLRTAEAEELLAKLMEDEDKIVRSYAAEALRLRLERV